MTQTLKEFRSLRARLAPHLRDTFSVETVFDPNAQGSGNPGLVTEPRWGSITDQKSTLAGVFPLRSLSFGGTGRSGQNSRAPSPTLLQFLLDRFQLEEEFTPLFHARLQLALRHGHLVTHEIESPHIL